MKRFVDNKIAFFAVASLFAFALAWNVGHGGNAFVGTHQMLAPTLDDVRIVHEPPICSDCFVPSAEKHSPPVCGDCFVSPISDAGVIS